ncbi:MAG: LysR family transcriptional regulator [Treponema sp.]|nr:LysR family transcriptional regulator [Treponema sp.]MBD5443299.1 LysR family transcriptional regulator [Treponema sp.]
MEFRVLKYFLAVAREQTFLGAAEALHVTQPTLSRQIQDLENELGKTLIVRSSRKISLTEEGMIFRKRAEEICKLVEKTQNEILDYDGTDVAGDIFIGAGETDAVRRIARVAKIIQKKHPFVHFHISSGDAADIIEDLDKGLLDFALVFTPLDIEKYNRLELESKTVWGLFLRKDNPFAEKDFITNADLQKIPLMISRQTKGNVIMKKWLGTKLSELNIVGTYSLLYNATFFVEEGFASVLSIDGIINTKDTNLVFRPLQSQPETKLCIVWKKQQVMTKASTVFLQEVSKECAQR